MPKENHHALPRQTETQSPRAQEVPEEEDAQLGGDPQEPHEVTCLTLPAGYEVQWSPVYEGTNLVDYRFEGIRQK